MVSKIWFVGISNFSLKVIFLVELFGNYFETQWVLNKFNGVMGWLFLGNFSLVLEFLEGETVFSKLEIPINGLENCFW